MDDGWPAPRCGSDHQDRFASGGRVRLAFRMRKHPEELSLPPLSGLRIATTRSLSQHHLRWVIQIGHDQESLRSSTWGDCAADKRF